VKVTPNDIENTEEVISTILMMTSLKLRVTKSIVITNRLHQNTSITKKLKSGLTPQNTK
jgi:hypothetical protein